MHCLATNIFQLFVSGGYGFMSIITLMLVGLFFAAWKAPNWIKEIGLFALAFGIFGFVLGMMQAAEFIQSYGGDLSPNVIWGGIKVALIAPAYGIIVYLVSLILRVIKKPRI